MPYSEYLADRIRSAFKENKTTFEEKKMFGGLYFFVDDKMCAGAVKEELIVRIAPEDEHQYLQEGDCRELDETNHSMKGFLYISPEGIDMDEDLDKWIKRCIAFNPKAKASKKKK
ncbi:TfoX/Sxy family protein [Draconibacterium sp.]|jgi:TfoX/Sxy family transcriptional regulator of competence genes